MEIENITEYNDQQLKNLLGVSDGSMLNEIKEIINHEIIDYLWEETLL